MAPPDQARKSPTASRNAGSDEPNRECSLQVAKAGVAGPVDLKCDLTRGVRYHWSQSIGTLVENMVAPAALSGGGRKAHIRELLSPVTAGREQDILQAALVFEENN